MKDEAVGRLCAYRQTGQHPNPSAHVIGATYQVIKPLKKDTSRIANNTSNKRIYALSTNIELSFKEKVQGITSLFSLPYNDCNLQINQGQNNNKNLLKCINELFLQFDSQAHKYKSTHSVYCNLTETDVMSIIQRLVENFQDIFHRLASCFLNQQEKIITIYQKNVFDIGKQFDSLTEKLKQQEKKNKNLQYKLKKLMKTLEQKQQICNFTSQVFQEMERKSINVQQWIFQSSVFKRIAQKKGFIRSEGMQIPILSHEAKVQQQYPQIADSIKQIKDQTTLKKLST